MELIDASLPNLQSLGNCCEADYRGVFRLRVAGLRLLRFNSVRLGVFVMRKDGRQSDYQRF
jgi:hypothetical protein